MNIKELLLKLYELFIDDGIEREPYPEPRSPSGFGWRPVKKDK
jgi:hypothetical protein